MGKRDGERERLLRIISMCLAVERRSSDPFAVQVKDVLGTLRQYLPHWTVFEDFTLDAEALNRVASIVQLQGKWTKERSTSLYVDPLLIELKVKMMTRAQLITVFARSWHPIVEMEGLTRKRVDDAVHYWNQLLSLEEKRLRLPTPSKTLGSTTVEELLKLRILSEDSFNTLLQRFWEELKGKTVYVAGHRGMVGSALMRRLGSENVELLTATREEADLRDQAAVNQWFAAKRHDRTG